MSKYKVLYNPKSNSNKGLENVQGVKELVKGAECEFIDVLKTDKAGFFAGLEADDKVVICGGDGTINHLINDVDTTKTTNEIYLYATGTGNDFLSSIGAKAGELVRIDQYLSVLPTVIVNGKEYKFINGVGFGIDGYCCEVGDEQRLKSDKPVNYTSIAINGLLFHFKPVNATITYDGKTRTFSKVWLAPTMFGAYYGGGMIPTPDQRRDSGYVSTMVYYGKGKIKSLMVFPSIFKGEHVKHTEMIEIIKSKEVTVEFDRPTALQIDGETIKNVTKYTVKAPV